MFRIIQLFRLLMVELLYKTRFKQTNNQSTFNQSLQVVKRTIRNSIILPKIDASVAPSSLSCHR